MSSNNPTNQQSQTQRRLQQHHPFLVQLVNVEDKSHRCLGTLITRDLVLTAAHCLYDTNILVRHHRRDNDNDEQQGISIFYYAVQAIRTHPEYYYNTYTGGVDVDPYDVAIVQLYGNALRLRPISATTNITSSSWWCSTASSCLVRLNRNSSIPRDQDRLIGLGWKSSVSSTSEQEESTTLTYVPNDRCINVSGKSSSGTHIDYHSQIIDVSLCALYLEGPGLCPGDSGGPLFRYTASNGNTTLWDESNHPWVQLGITSASYGCNSPVLPNLNVRISEVADWIDSTVCEWSLYAVPPDFQCNSSSTKWTLGSTNQTSARDVKLTVELHLPSQPESWGWILYLVNSEERLRSIVERPLFHYRQRSPNSIATEKVLVNNNSQYLLVMFNTNSDGDDDADDDTAEDVGAGTVIVYYQEGNLSINQTTTVLVTTITSGQIAQPFRFDVGYVTTEAPTLSRSTLQPTSIPHLPYLTVVIALDDYPTETGFLVDALLANDDNSSVADPVLVYATYPGTFGPDQAQLTVDVIVPLWSFSSRTRDFCFTMTDNEEDGLDPPAYYEVWLGPNNNLTGQLLISGGVFFLEDRHNFTVPQFFQNTYIPAPSPTSHPTSAMASSGIVDDSGGLGGCPSAAALLSLLMLTQVLTRRFA